MIFWLNAQLPPTFAKWLSETFEVSVVALQELGLRDAQDIEIFHAARSNGAGTGYHHQGSRFYRSSDSPWKPTSNSLANLWKYY